MAAAGSARATFLCAATNQITADIVHVNSLTPCDVIDFGRLSADFLTQQVKPRHSRSALVGVADDRLVQNLTSISWEALQQAEQLCRVQKQGVKMVDLQGAANALVDLATSSIDVLRSCARYCPGLADSFAHSNLVPRLCQHAAHRDSLLHRRALELALAMIPVSDESPLLSQQLLWLLWHFVEHCDASFHIQGEFFLVLRLLYRWLEGSKPDAQATRLPLLLGFLSRLLSRATKGSLQMMSFLVQDVLLQRLLPFPECAAALQSEPCCSLLARLHKRVAVLPPRVPRSYSAQGIALQQMLLLRDVLPGLASPALCSGDVESVFDSCSWVGRA